MSIGLMSTDDLQTGEPLPVEVDFGAEGTRLFLYKGLFGESPYESPDQYAVDWCFLSKRITQYQLETARSQLIVELQRRYGRWYYSTDIDILQVKGVYSVLIHGSEFAYDSTFRLHKDYKEYPYIYEVQYAIKTVAESVRAMDELKKDVETKSKNKGSAMKTYKNSSEMLKNGEITVGQFKRAIEVALREMEIEDIAKKVVAHTRKTSKLYKVIDFNDNELERGTDINKLKSTFQKKYPYFKPKDIDPFIYEI